MELRMIGQRIKIARESACITQDMLAEKVGCTVQHISAIERGIKTPRLDTFIAITNAIGVPSDLLLQDVLDNSTDTLACEFAAATSALPREMQLRILGALQCFCRNW